MIKSIGKICISPINTASAPMNGATKCFGDLVRRSLTGT
jgi:hypothetical protein